MKLRRVGKAAPIRVNRQTTSGGLNKASSSAPVALALDGPAGLLTPTFIESDSSGGPERFFKKRQPVTAHNSGY